MKTIFAVAMMACFFGSHPAAADTASDPSCVTKKTLSYVRFEKVDVDYSRVPENAVKLSIKGMSAGDSVANVTICPGVEKSVGAMIVASDKGRDCTTRADERLGALNTSVLLCQDSKGQYCLKSAEVTQVVYGHTSPKIISQYEGSDSLDANPSSKPIYKGTKMKPTSEYSDPPADAPK